MTDTRPMPDQQLPPRAPARPRPGRVRRILKRLVYTVIVGLSLLVIAFSALLVLTPSADEATRIAADQASARGIAYPGPPVPANFARPLVATEDKRFYSEPGVDPFAVVRFAVSQITGNTSDAGGATLEQQLAKLLYTPGRGGAAAEAEQVALAVKLNFTYSKAQILRLYAEVAYYGHGYYGLEAASCGYFGHPAADLTPVQGAMLAGVVNAPTLDDPISDPVNARSRLDHVIGRMQAVGDITSQAAAQLRHASLGLVPRADAGC